MLYDGVLLIRHATRDKGTRRRGDEETRFNLEGNPVVVPPPSPPLSSRPVTSRPYARSRYPSSYSARRHWLSAHTSSIDEQLNSRNCIVKLPSKVGGNLCSCIPRSIVEPTLSPPFPRSRLTRTYVRIGSRDDYGEKMSSPRPRRCKQSRVLPGFNNDFPPVDDSEFLINPGCMSDGPWQPRRKSFERTFFIFNQPRAIWEPCCMNSIYRVIYARLERRPR